MKAVAQIIRRYHCGFYSRLSAKRELIGLGLTPDEAEKALAPKPPTSAVENSDRAGVPQESQE